MAIAFDKNKPADAILCADIHIRPDTPKCRTDDFQDALWSKWFQIINLSLDNNGCPILVAGDLGNKAEWPDWMLREFIKSVRLDPNIGEVVVIPGQHDLPNHSNELWHKAAIGVLDADETIILLDPEAFYPLRRNIDVYGYPFGIEINPDVDLSRKTIKIAMSHQLVMEGKNNQVDFKTNSGYVFGIDLLKRYPNYNLILTGDNHKPFVIEHEGRLLVNPGSMMRSTADQIEHRPRVYLWDSDTNTVKPNYLSIEEGVISRDHIEEQKKKDERMEAFISSVKSGVEIKLSFEDNMENYLRDNPQSKSVEDKIWECVK